MYLCVRDREMRLGAELAYWITPKSGPIRPLRTLRDSNRAMLDDLPSECRTRRHWLDARLLLLAAADSADPHQLLAATDALVRALETEGWMSPAREKDCRAHSSRTRPVNLNRAHCSYEKNCTPFELSNDGSYPFSIAAE